MSDIPISHPRCRRRLGYYPPAGGWIILPASPGCPEGWVAPYRDDAGDDILPGTCASDPACAEPDDDGEGAGELYPCGEHPEMRLSVKKTVTDTFFQDTTYSLRIKRNIEPQPLPGAYWHDWRGPDGRLVQWGSDNPRYGRGDVLGNVLIDGAWHYISPVLIDGEGEVTPIIDGAWMYGDTLIIGFSSRRVGSYYASDICTQQYYFDWVFAICAYYPDGSREMLADYELPAVDHGVTTPGYECPQGPVDMRDIDSWQILSSWKGSPDGSKGVMLASLDGKPDQLQLLAELTADPETGEVSATITATELDSARFVATQTTSASNNTYSLDFVWAPITDYPLDSRCPGQSWEGVVWGGTGSDVWGNLESIRYGQRGTFHLWPYRPKFLRRTQRDFVPYPSSNHECQNTDGEGVPCDHPDAVRRIFIQGYRFDNDEGNSSISICGARVGQQMEYSTPPPWYNPTFYPNSFTSPMPGNGYQTLPVTYQPGDFGGALQGEYPEALQFLWAGVMSSTSYGQWDVGSTPVGRFFDGDDDGVLSFGDDAADYPRPHNAGFNLVTEYATGYTETGTVSESENRVYAGREYIAADWDADGELILLSAEGAGTWDYTRIGSMSSDASTILDDTEDGIVESVYPPEYNEENGGALRVSDITASTTVAQAVDFKIGDEVVYPWAESYSGDGKLSSPDSDQWPVAFAVDLRAGAVEFFERVAPVDFQYVTRRVQARGTVLEEGQFVGGTQPPTWNSGAAAVDKKGRVLVTTGNQAGVGAPRHWVLDADGTQIAATEELRELIGIPDDDDDYTINPMRSQK